MGDAGGGMGWCGRSQAGASSKATSPGWGSCRTANSRDGCVRAVSPGVGQATDLSVAQAVVDEGEEFAGGGDPADVAVVAPLGDPVRRRLEEGSAPVAADRLDGRPPDELGALFGDRAPLDGGVRLAMAGRQPGPAGQLVGGGEAGDVADLGGE